MQGFDVNERRKDRAVFPSVKNYARRSIAVINDEERERGYLHRIEIAFPGAKLGFSDQ